MARSYTSDEESGIFREHGTIHYKYRHHPTGTEEENFVVGCSVEGVPERYREMMEFYCIKMKLWLQAFMMDIYKEIEK